MNKQMCFTHSMEQSVQFSCSVVSDSLWPHESQHARPPCPSPTPGVHSDSHPLSPWCHPAISSSVFPFSSCPQYLPASESFPMSQLFVWGGQSTGVSALASFFPKKSQGWSPSELVNPKGSWLGLGNSLAKALNAVRVQGIQIRTEDDTSLLQWFPLKEAIISSAFLYLILLCWAKGSSRKWRCWKRKWHLGQAVQIEEDTQKEQRERQCQYWPPSLVLIQFQAISSWIPAKKLHYCFLF